MSPVSRLLSSVRKVKSGKILSLRYRLDVRSFYLRIGAEDKSNQLVAGSR